MCECVHEHLSPQRGVRGEHEAIIIISDARWKRGFGEGKIANLNPSTHKDEKMPAIRRSVNRNPLTKWGVRSCVQTETHFVSFSVLDFHFSM